MKVLFVITRGDSIGGAQTHVVSLAEKFKDDLHDVCVCFGGENYGPFKEMLIRANLKHQVIPSLKREIDILNDIRSVMALNHIIKTYQPDIVSLHSSKVGVIGRVSAMFLNVPVVFTAHGWAFTDGVQTIQSKIFKMVERIMSFLAARIIVVSKYDQYIALQNRIVSKRKISLVYNGIKTFPYSKDLNTDKDVLDLIMVARFDEQKDHETLIYACKDIENLRIHLLGDGPKQPVIKDLVNKTGLQDKVLFHGYQKDVSAFLKNSDIFVLISNWEGFPISTLEAMNYSLPIIISDVGGAAEAIKEGISGFTVKRKDIQGLSEKIRTLAENKHLRSSFGLEAKKAVNNNFSLEKMYRDTLKVFNEVIR